MSIAASDLHGAWRLESWSLVYTDGRTAEFPLGRDAHGIIMYTPDGHVSATLMRAGRSRATPISEAERGGPYGDSFAYAGRYDVRDGCVMHSIEIATDPAIAGVTSTRRIDLQGDRLTLSGPDFSGAQPRAHRIVWRRVA